MYNVPVIAQESTCKSGGRAGGLYVILYLVRYCMSKNTHRNSRKISQQVLVNKLKLSCVVDEITKTQCHGKSDTAF